MLIVLSNTWLSSRIPASVGIYLPYVQVCQLSCSTIRGSVHPCSLLHMGLLSLLARQ